MKITKTRGAKIAIIAIIILLMMALILINRGQGMSLTQSINQSMNKLVSHWQEAKLSAARSFSGSNDYLAPPEILAVDKHAIKKVYQKMADFYPLPSAPKAKPLHDAAAQVALPITMLDTRQLKAGQTVNVQGHVKLIPENADLWQKNIHFVINQSDTILDCQGAQLSSSDDTVSAIAIRTPPDQTGIFNIQVKNCLLTGYNHGVVIEQQTPANQRYEQLQTGQTSIAQQLAQSPHQILIDNVTVTHSHNSGIFVGDHVQGVDFNRIAVLKSGTVGLYFEFGSRGNVVRHSFFSQNGVRQVLGVGKPNREAIAIDSSANNRIEQSHFDHNGAGGVFLYRNCFEHADDPSKPNHFLRTQGSNNNLIAHNIFEREPVGVWIASRQSRNLKGFACGAYTISETPFASYHLDESEHNQIWQNLFLANKTGIIVEDDNNRLQANQFDQQVVQPIVIGSKIRLQSNEGAVKNNQLANNTLLDNQRTEKNSSHRRDDMVKFVGDSEWHHVIQP